MKQEVFDNFKALLDEANAEYSVEDDVVTITYAPKGFANMIRDLPDLTILDEKIHPDYTGLVVRVAGFSAYWIDCHKEVQDQIIARTKQRL